jgi:hypothetical protein
LGFFPETKKKVHETTELRSLCFFAPHFIFRRMFFVVSLAGGKRENSEKSIYQQSGRWQARNKNNLTFAWRFGFGKARNERRSLDKLTRCGRFDTIVSWDFVMFLLCNEVSLLFESESCWKRKKLGSFVTGGRWIRNNCLQIPN